jgi:ACS family allantoate permease-like MFS transporter
MSEAHVDTADRRASDGKSAVDVEKETITQESTRDSRGIVPEDIIKHSHDADEALKAFEAHRGHSIEIDEATSKRLLRKIDWNMMPVSRRLHHDLSQQI